MKRQRLIAVVTLTTLLTTLLSGCAVKIAVPEVKEGRFDFSVTYEVNGEEKTYEAVYVCKYDGVYVALDGRGRRWESYIENNDSGKLIVQTNEDGMIYIDFNFNPQYFMSDPASVNFDTPKPTLLMVYQGENPDELIYSDEIDFMNDYGVQIISYHYADPIENNYQEKLTFGETL